MADVVLGAMCVVERRFSHVPRSDPPQNRYQTVITRLTPARAYLGTDWFSLGDPNREVKPRYLDYRTYVVEVKP